MQKMPHTVNLLKGSVFMKKKLIPTLLAVIMVTTLIFSSMSVFAAGGVVTVDVKDSSGNALNGASVSITYSVTSGGTTTSGTQTATTANGICTLNIPVDGTFAITATYGGYSSYTGYVAVTSANPTFNITLSPYNNGYPGNGYIQCSTCGQYHSNYGNHVNGVWVPSYNGNGYDQYYNCGICGKYHSSYGSHDAYNNWVPSYYNNDYYYNCGVCGKYHSTYGYHDAYNNWIPNYNNNNSNANKKVSISFDSNYGSSVASRTYYYGEPFVQPNEPTLAGYVFGGWYTDASLLNLFSMDTPVTKDMVLYARWLETQETYDKNHGNITKPNPAPVAPTPPSSVPQTGDNTPIVPILAVVGLSILVLARKQKVN